jgi:dCTP deaminase
MILKSDRIAELLLRGRDVATIDPFVIRPCPDLDLLKEQGSASVDLRLGKWFVALRGARMPCLDIAEQDTQASQLTKSHYVPFLEPFYLHPGSFILSVTLEWMCVPRDIAAYVIGKSSLGRRGLIIATATGVHPGFKGCLTLELTNVGQIPIAIRPGMHICQLFFHSVVEEGGGYEDQSPFVGHRKPTLGTVKLDRIARLLSGAKIGIE